MNTNNNITPIVEWVDELPAAQGRRGGHRSRFVAQLATQPGRWAIYTKLDGTPSHPSSGWSKAYKERHNIEIAVRGRMVYVRVKP